MSSQFTVDTERIAAASGDIQRISGEVDAQVAAMMSRLTGLQDAWQGSASQRFQGVVAEWRATQMRVRESLDHISRALAQAGSSYNQAEQQNTAMFSG
ncbi:MAG: WXG100 family type VII secretion target [Oryzihumus sp.]